MISLGILTSDSNYLSINHLPSKAMGIHCDIFRYSHSRCELLWKQRNEHTLWYYQGFSLIIQITLQREKQCYTRVSSGILTYDSN